MYTVVIPKIIVKDTKLVDKNTGAFVQEQTITISHPDLIAPIPASVLLSQGRKPYEVGRYELLAESLMAGKYGRPEFRPQIGKRLDVAAKAA